MGWLGCQNMFLCSLKFHFKIWLCARLVKRLAKRGILVTSSAVRERESSKAGLCSGLLIASWFVTPTKPSVWNSLNASWRVATLSTTWFSATIARSPSSLIVVHVSEWRTKPQSASRNRTIHSKFMYGGISRHGATKICIFVRLKRGRK